MGYELRSGVMYMMPTHFGPMSGPRQGPDGRRFACEDNPKSTSYAVSFLTAAAQLEPLLPPGFTLAGEPVVTVTQTYMKQIEWLAGRGYNTLGVTFPVAYTGERDRARGSFLTVLWENLADPILTGREQLGFAKIYCELPEPVVRRDQTELGASWLGYRFMDMRLSAMQQVPAAELPPPASQSAAADDGVLAGDLHYKYVPRTGQWGDADVEYAVLTPAGGSHRVVDAMWRGSGSVAFHQARWEDLPTQYMIVNAFAGLEIVEYRGATITCSTGGKDLSDQRMLR